MRTVTWLRRRQRGVGTSKPYQVWETPRRHTHGGWTAGEMEEGSFPFHHPPAVCAPPHAPPQNRCARWSLFLKCSPLR